MQESLFMLRRGAETPGHLLPTLWGRRNIAENHSTGEDDPDSQRHFWAGRGAGGAKLSRRSAGTGEWDSTSSVYTQPEGEPEGKEAYK